MHCADEERNRSESRPEREAKSFGMESDENAKIAEQSKLGVSDGDVAEESAMS